MHSLQQCCCWHNVSANLLQFCIKLIMKIRFMWAVYSVLCVHSAVHHFVWTKVLCSCSSSYLRGILYIHGIFLDEKIHDFSFVSSFILHAHIYIHTNKNWHIFEREKNLKKKHIDRLSCSFQFYTAKIIMVHLKEQI